LGARAGLGGVVAGGLGSRLGVGVDDDILLVVR
jgi:hypothetical protein